MTDNQVFIGGGKRERKSNIELCRIVSIVMVMLLHSDFQIFGWPQTLSDTSLGMIALESFCIIGVNVFVLITGYFSTKPKLSSLLNLFYICLFYGIFKICVDVCTGHPITIKQCFLFTRSNWFIPTYLGLVLFAPALNALCEKLNQKQLAYSILALVGYETYMGFFPAMPQLSVGFEHGCSVLSFMVLYLIGRYLYMYGLPQKFYRLCLPTYVACSLLVAVVEYLALSHNLGSKAIRIFDYSNPIIILSAVSFFLYFTKIDIGYSKIINYISKSVLAVLLVHASGTAMRYINPQYIYIYENFSGIMLVFLWIISIIVTFTFSVLLDQIRIWSYKYVSKYTLNR